MDEQKRKELADILSRGITYSPQTGTVVIHGAIDELLQKYISKKEYYAALEKGDDQFNTVVKVCGELANHAAGHNLGGLNEWLDKYANEEDWTINWRKIIETRK